MVRIRSIRLTTMLQKAHSPKVTSRRPEGTRCCTDWIGVRYASRTESASRPRVIKVILATDDPLFKRNFRLYGPYPFGIIVSDERRVERITVDLRCGDPDPPAIIHRSDPPRLFERNLLVQQIE